MWKVEAVRLWVGDLQSRPRRACYPHEYKRSPRIAPRAPLLSGLLLGKSVQIIEAVSAIGRAMRPLTPEVQLPQPLARSFDSAESRVSADLYSASCARAAALALRK